MLGLPPSDERIMPREERMILVQMLDKIDPESKYADTLEEESIDAYENTLKRLRASVEEEFAEKNRKGNSLKNEKTNQV